MNKCAGEESEGRKGETGIGEQEREREKERGREGGRERHTVIPNDRLCDYCLWLPADARNL